MSQKHPNSTAIALASNLSLCRQFAGMKSGVSMRSRLARNSLRAGCVCLLLLLRDVVEHAYAETFHSLVMSRFEKGGFSPESDQSEASEGSGKSSSRYFQKPAQHRFPPLLTLDSEGLSSSGSEDGLRVVSLDDSSFSDSQLPMSDNWETFVDKMELISTQSHRKDNQAAARLKAVKRADKGAMAAMGTLFGLAANMGVAGAVVRRTRSVSFWPMVGTALLLGGAVACAFGFAATAFRGHTSRRRCFVEEQLRLRKMELEEGSVKKEFSNVLKAGGLP